MQPAQHLRRLLIFLTPSPPRRLIDIAEIEGVTNPHPHLVGGCNSHHQKPFELRRRSTLLGKPLRQIGADRFRSSPQLVAKPCRSIDGKPKVSLCTSSDSR